MNLEYISAAPDDGGGLGGSDGEVVGGATFGEGSSKKSGTGYPRRQKFVTSSAAAEEELATAAATRGRQRTRRMGSIVSGDGGGSGTSGASESSGLINPTTLRVHSTSGGRRMRRTLEHRLRGSCDNPLKPIAFSQQPPPPPPPRRFTLGQAMRGTDTSKGSRVAPMLMPATGHATLSSVCGSRDSTSDNAQKGGQGGGMKLSVVSKYITHLSGVPPSVAAPVTQLLLSNNSLRGLGRLSGQLFPNLEAVSLSNNQLRYLEDLVPLTTLPKLLDLILEGNPVTHMPNYRAQLVAHLPRLIMLDKRAVGSDPDFQQMGVHFGGSSGEQHQQQQQKQQQQQQQSVSMRRKASRAAAERERAAAANAARREGSLQEALFDNACATRALQFLRLLLAVHAELRRRLLGGPLVGRAAHLPDSSLASGSGSDGFGSSFHGGGMDSNGGSTVVASPTLADVLRVWRPSHWVRRFPREARRVHRAVQDDLALRFYRALEARGSQHHYRNHHHQQQGDGSTSASANNNTKGASNPNSNNAAGAGGRYVTAPASSVTVRALGVVETHRLWDKLMTQQLQAQQEVLVLLVKACELHRSHADFYRRSQPVTGTGTGSSVLHPSLSSSAAMRGGEGLRQFLQAETTDIAAQLIHAKAPPPSHGMESCAIAAAAVNVANVHHLGGGGLSSSSHRPLWGAPTLPPLPLQSRDDFAGSIWDTTNNESFYDDEEAASAFRNSTAAFADATTNPRRCRPTSIDGEDSYSPYDAQQSKVLSERRRFPQDKILVSRAANLVKTAVAAAAHRGSSPGRGPRRRTTTTIGEGTNFHNVDDDGGDEYGGGAGWEEALEDIPEPSASHRHRSKDGAGGVGRAAAAGADEYLKILKKGGGIDSSSFSFSSAATEAHNRMRQDLYEDYGAGGGRGISSRSRVTSQQQQQQQQQQKQKQRRCHGSPTVRVVAQQVKHRLTPSMQNTPSVMGHRSDGVNTQKVHNQGGGSHERESSLSPRRILVQPLQHPSINAGGGSDSRRTSFATSASMSRPPSGQSLNNLIRQQHPGGGGNGMRNSFDESLPMDGLVYGYDEDLSYDNGGQQQQMQLQQIHPDDVAQAELVLRESMSNFNGDDGGEHGCGLMLEALPTPPLALEALLGDGSGSGGGYGNDDLGGRPTTPELVEGGHSMRELEGHVQESLEKLKGADEAVCEAVRLNSTLRQQFEEVVRLRDRRCETLLVQEERLVQRHNCLLDAIDYVTRELGVFPTAAEKAISGAPLSQGWRSVEFEAISDSASGVGTSVEESRAEADARKAREADLKQAEDELEERRAIERSAAERVDAEQAKVDAEQERRETLLAEKERIERDRQRCEARLKEVRAAFMLSAGNKTVGGVRLRTLEESDLAGKLFGGGLSLLSWAFGRLRRCCNIRRRFRESAILGPGILGGNALAVVPTKEVNRSQLQRFGDQRWERRGGDDGGGGGGRSGVSTLDCGSVGGGGGWPMRRKRTFLRRLRLSTALKRLRKRLQMVRALWSWKVNLAIGMWRAQLCRRQCKAAVAAWWGRVAEKKTQRRALEHRLTEGGKDARNDQIVLLMLGGLGGATGGKGDDAAMVLLQLRRFLGAWHGLVHGIVKRLTVVALAFWTVRFLRRWLRHAKSTSARLALRGEQAAAKARFVTWRRAWQVRKQGLRSFKRRLLLRLADATDAHRTRREHRHAAGYLGERALLQRTFWIFQKETYANRVSHISNQLIASG